MLIKYRHYHRERICWSNRGFSLVELLIVMAIFTVAMAISSSVFVNILGQSKQQGKLAETQMESVPGLEMMRSDLESAGYGLPWLFPNSPSVTYQEANVPGNNQVANAFNIAPGIPKALDGNTVGPNVAGSSYLVIRASKIALNAQSQTWTGVLYNGQISGLAGLGSDQPQIGTGVIVLNTKDDAFRQLIVSPAGAFSVAYTNPLNPAFAPLLPLQNNLPSQLFMIYGVDDAAPLRMPFNRADYSIATGGPSNCAPGTGVLTKSIVRHDNGTLNTVPILDCVADFQVWFGFDTANAGGNYVYSPNLTVDPITLQPTVTPDVVRNEVKEIRVYILLHEGRKDPSFNFSDFSGGGTKIKVGDNIGGQNVGRNFDLANIANYQNYRWKVITLVVTPKNLK